MLAAIPKIGTALPSLTERDVKCFASSTQERPMSFYVATDMDGGVTVYEIRRSIKPYASLIRKASGPKSSTEFKFFAEKNLDLQVGETLWAKLIVSPWAPTYDAIVEDHGHILVITYAASGLSGDELTTLMQEALNNRSALREQSLQTA